MFIISGGTNKVKDVCEYYLSGFNLTKRIEPSIISGTDSSYNVKSEENVYIDLSLVINNLYDEEKMAEDIITAKIKISGKEYNCFSVAESVDGSSLEDYPSIKSMESKIVHYLSEVPLVEATGEIEVILSIDGRDFSNKFNL